MNEINEKRKTTQFLDTRLKILTFVDISQLQGVFCMKNKHKIWLLAIIGCAILALSLAGCREDPIDGPPTLASIEVTTEPKTDYRTGDTLDLSGMVVTARYSDGTENVVTGFTTTPAAGAALNTAGANIPVQVSYIEDGITRTTTFSITVNIKSSGGTDGEVVLAFYWVNEQTGVLFGTEGNGTDGGFTLSRSAGQTLSITAQDADYTNQRWFIGGVPQTALNGEASLTFNSASRPNGVYRIDLMVEKGGVNYSRSFTVTVIN
jgi:hypothetical protein